MPAARAAVDFFFARAPHVAEPDLHDGAHPGQLAQPPDRARVAVAQTGDLVTEVQVRVDVQDVERPVVRQAADDDRRRRVVAGDDQRGGAGRDDLPHGGGPGGQIGGEVAGVAAQDDVAAVDEARVDAGRHERTAEVEVVVVEDGCVAGRCLPHGVGGAEAGRARRGRLVPVGHVQRQAEKGEARRRGFAGERRARRSERRAEERPV